MWVLLLVLFSDQAVTVSDQEVGRGSRGAELHGLWEGLLSLCQEGKSGSMLVGSWSHILNRLWSLSSSLNIQHHCRHCGNIFCAECSAKNALTPSSKKPVRVCETCFEELQGWFPSPIPLPLTPLPSPPSYSSRQKKACLRHILMCTIKDRPSARLPPACDSWPWHGGKQLKGFFHGRDARATWRESGGTGWDCLYLFLCLCYSCGLPESGDSENSTPSISFKFMFTSPSLFGIVCDCKVVAFCCKNVGHQEVEGQCDTAGVTAEVNIGNRCCPTKVHASNYCVQEKWHFLCLATSIWPFTKKTKIHLGFYWKINEFGED